MRQTNFLLLIVLTAAFCSLSCRKKQEDPQPVPAVTKIALNSETFYDGESLRLSFFPENMHINASYKTNITYYYSTDSIISANDTKSSKQGIVYGGSNNLQDIMLEHPSVFAETKLFLIVKIAVLENTSYGYGNAKTISERTATFRIVLKAEPIPVHITQTTILDTPVYSKANIPVQYTITSPAGSNSLSSLKLYFNYYLSTDTIASYDDITKSSTGTPIKPYVTDNTLTAPFVSSATEYYLIIKPYFMENYSANFLTPVIRKMTVYPTPSQIRLSGNSNAYLSSDDYYSGGHVTSTLTFSNSFISNQSVYFDYYFSSDSKVDASDYKSTSSAVIFPHTTTLSLNVPLPTVSSATAYNLLIVPRYEDRNGSYATTYIYGDTLKSTITVKPYPSYLTITKASLVKNEYTLGNTVPIAIDINNTNIYGAAASLHFFLSADNVFSGADDIYLNSQCTPNGYESINAGGKSFNSNIYLSSESKSIAEGTYYIIIKYYETRYSSITQTFIGPQVKVNDGIAKMTSLSVNGSSFSAGSSIPVNITVSSANEAEQTMYVSYYFSADTTKSADDIYITNTSWTSKYGISYFTPTITAPANMTPGNYYLICYYGSSMYNGQKQRQTVNRITIE